MNHFIDGWQQKQLQILKPMHTYFGRYNKIYKLSKWWKVNTDELQIVLEKDKQREATEDGGIISV